MLSDHNPPLRVMFLTTSLPVGGAETLLMNLVRGMDHERFAPEIICLKDLGPLGEVLAEEMPVHCNLLSGKFDLRVLPRLVRLLKAREIDAVVTVGAGDKMFWGRLAANLAGVPVILSALHSTGWPDSVGKLNRWLTPITDGFIGVADAHADHLAANEGFPRERVHTIYNGVDTEKFAPNDSQKLRQELGIDDESPVVGILAALRPEKNHELFLAGAKRILEQVPDAHFVIIGDGDRRGPLDDLAEELGIIDVVHFLGSRSDVHEILPSIDVIALTSHNEASPVSILEALSCGVPVVASRVGSVPETVLPGQTGELFEPGKLEEYLTSTVQLLLQPEHRKTLGRQGRDHVVENCSLDSMVHGYERLIESVYEEKLAESGESTEIMRAKEKAPNLRSRASHSGA